MKRILMILSVLMAFLPILNARSVINPHVKLNSTEKGEAKVTICGVDIHKDATTVRMKVKFKPERWIYVSKNTILRTGNDNHYLTDTRGIKAGEQQWMPQTGILEFDMVFPPISANTKSIDIIEPDGWQFIGIDLTEGKKPEQFFSQFVNGSEFAYAMQFAYAYYSPLMLRTLDTKTLQNLPVEKLKMLEMVSTKMEGKDKKLSNAIRNAISANNMELVFKEEGSDERSLEFYAQLDPSGTLIKKILIAQYGVFRESARILYAECDFRIDELKSLIDTQKGVKKKQ